MRHNGPLQDPSNLYVLIPNLISQIAILLVKICLIPTIASTFLTITFFILFFSCSGFSNVLPSRFSARLPQLSYIPLEQFILKGCQVIPCSWMRAIRFTAHAFSVMRPA